MAKAKRVLRRLLALGWVIGRQTGSHKILKKAGCQQVTFAYHDKAELGPIQIAQVAKQAGCKPDELV